MAKEKDEQLEEQEEKVAAAAVDMVEEAGGSDVAEEDEHKSHHVNVGKGHKFGKKYQEMVKKLVKTEDEEDASGEATFSLQEALELAKQTSPAKFDASVEAHVRLNLKAKEADQLPKTSILLPAGTGKTVKVTVFCSDAMASKAKAAGADFVGEEELIAKVKDGWTDFDVAIATPDMMPKLAQVAKILGTKGLMPNPKVGTVTTDIEKAVAEAKQGRITLKIDAAGIVHIGLGKVSFEVEALKQNFAALMDTVNRLKPGPVAQKIKSIYITTSMGPSIRVALDQLQ